MGAAFTLHQTDAESGARLGRLHTLHGEVPTPIFMPVGTQGTVKGLLPWQLEAAGTKILLGNTYHLNLRPGSEQIAALGGLHGFMGWAGPILTDSGGFQVFSLAKLRKIEREGIRFRSHIDGREVLLSPARVVEIQANLGSDIAMVLDECPPAAADRSVCGEAVERSLRWAAGAREEAQRTGFLAGGHHLFGIVQGGRFPELRKACAKRLVEMDFPGYAIGGVSVGEPEEEMLPQVAACTETLPGNKPRYVMGVGTPPQLLRMIALGADMFDCVMPTREARHGIAYTATGKLNLKNQRFRDDARPLEESFTDHPLGRFSRAYIRHLIVSREILGAVILSYHNVRFFLDLMKHARRHIAAGTFKDWSSEWISRYRHEQPGTT
ncbi:MAG: tRNA guanosine(34) transglycosylase Tgt [Verrucomicrobia bacterium]|jgi:queuine tRNA-ribosyltransferase|nr:tRNA guanosine(34) transglycosylase Tgt [Verrucomicrobiota bacterium]